MLASLLLSAALAAAPGPAPEVVLAFDTLVAPSITELDAGEVTFSSRVTIPAGERFSYDYTDPRDGDTYRVSMTLTPLTATTVGVEISWRSLTGGAVRMERQDLAVDGEMVLSLHPAADGEGETFLRLAPTIRAAR